MVAVNPDPHARTYQYSPAYKVRGVFASSDNVESVLQSLLDTGFTEIDIELYLGNEGVEKLDSSGKHHGMITRLLRDIESTFFADDTAFQAKVDEVLKSGGFAIDVFTHNETEKKTRAACALKAGNATDVVYWGNLAVEWL